MNYISYNEAMISKYQLFILVLLAYDTWEIESCMLVIFEETENPQVFHDSIMDSITEAKCS